MNVQKNSVSRSLQTAKPTFERLVDNFCQSNENIPPFINKENALSEFESLHARMMAHRNKYLNIKCKERVIDFWGYIYSMYHGQYKNVCKIFEACIVAQINICCCERVFGMRKLILSARRASMDSITVNHILRVKINSCDTDEFEKCKSLYQMSVHYFKNTQNNSQ